jgi:hypothetical protein
VSDFLAATRFVSEIMSFGDKFRFADNTSNGNANTWRGRGHFSGTIKKNWPVGRISKMREVALVSKAIQKLVVTDVVWCS